MIEWGWMAEKGAERREETAKNEIERKGEYLNFTITSLFDIFMDYTTE